MTFQTRVGLFVLALPLLLAAAPAPVPPRPLAPSEIVAAAPASEWVAIAPADMLVMELAPVPGSGAGTSAQRRRVVIQLMPPPFSQGWIANIRKLAAARWWDGLSVNRVQDNYVAQWGDANAEDKTKAKALPSGLVTVGERDYIASRIQETEAVRQGSIALARSNPALLERAQKYAERDAYSPLASAHRGWPIATDGENDWPVHCYGMVGVGRDLSPDTGSGAELYTVIGHAPRHLDRNIALVGRVIAGIEHLSSLPRGTGPLGFYEKPEQRTTITSIRLATDLPAADRPRFEYLLTESASFASYADARANRRDAFFIRPAGGADICNVPVPVRVMK